MENNQGEMVMPTETKGKWYSKFTMAKASVKKLFAFSVLSCISAASFAGGGVSAINASQTEVATYLDPVANLCLAIGAVVGIAGGIRIFIKWNGGDHEINKEVIGWMGSCVFLIMTSVVIKAFFV